MISFHVQEEVAQALREGKPVVALESTIISFGMSYPENINTALMVEKVVRSTGAVPATIAIIRGELKIGLDNTELELLATDKTVVKASRRDIPIVLALQQTAATTVSATMIGAALAGIKLFATGGIGGVHRRGENTMDISADLTELAKTNVAVVSAGAKSVLDIGRTLEYLETVGVPVLGYQTEELPAFYTRQSGYKVDYKIDTTADLARILKTKWEMGLDGGVLITNPIPQEFALEKSVIDKAIQEALCEADEKNILGKEITPFLLAKIKELTSGKSLEANIALILNNARLAGEIACELAELK